MKNKTKYLAKAVKEAVENILDDIDNGVPQNDALNDALGQYETELRFVLRESLKKREDEQTPMQSDQIVQLAQAIRLLAFHVDTKIVHPGGSGCREDLRGIRDNMEDLIFTIKGRP